MRSFLIVFSLIFVLQACGFRPMYGEQAAADIDLASISINAPHSRVEQVFYSHLQDVLNPTHEPAQKNYDLATTLKETSGSLAVQQNNAISRFRVTLTVNYTLTDRFSDKVMAEGSITRHGGFDKVESDYATYVTRKKTRERLARSVAEALRLELIRVKRP